MRLPEVLILFIVASRGNIEIEKSATVSPRSFNV
jgi:hypothetical protein